MAFKDPVGAFTKLRQMGNVEEYQTKFKIISNKVNWVNEDFHISTFLSGLKDDLWIIVTIFKPNTPVAAFGLESLQKEKVNRKQYPYKNNSTQNNLYTSAFKSPPKSLALNQLPKLPAPKPIL